MNMSMGIGRYKKLESRIGGQLKMDGQSMFPAAPMGRKGLPKIRKPLRKRVEV